MTSRPTPSPSVPDRRRHVALLGGWLLLLASAGLAQTNDDSLLSQPAVGKNADGHLEVFKVDADGELRHRWQKTSNGNWSSWSSLGGSCLPGIAVGNSTNNELVVFAVDRLSHALRYIRQKAPGSLDWSDWIDLGGRVQPPLAVGQDQAGRLEIFAVDCASQAVRHIRLSEDLTGWSPWGDLGGTLQPGLVVERNRDGRLELFGVEAGSEALLHCWQAGDGGGWSAWASLGGPIRTGFAVGQNVLGVVEVFAVNSTNSAVQRICQAAPGDSLHWTTWKDFGATARAGLAVGKSTGVRLELLAVDARDSTLLHRWETLNDGSDAWSLWASLGAKTRPFPVLLPNEDGDLEVFAADLTNSTRLIHRRQISRASGWLDWASLDRPTFQYSSRTWQMDEGLPHNTVQAIAQTRDGYLWVGTQAGLARFDGLVFTAFVTEAAPQLKKASITALCADRQGALWVGTQRDGLFRVQDGSCSHFGVTNGLAGNTINVVYERQDGSLWIGTTTGLSRFKDERFIHYTRQQGLSSDVIRSLLEDRDGNLWIANGEGLNRLRGEVVDAFPMPNGLPNDSVRSICQDRGGRIWIGSNNGMLWYSSFWGNFFAYNTRYGLSDSFVSAIREDREGNLWVGTYSGLNRFHEGRFYPELNNEGVPFDRVYALFEDRENNLWVGSKEGLVRLTPKRFTSITKHQGLTHNNITAVLENRAGSLWIGTWGGGLNRLKDERVTSFASTNKLSQSLVLSLAEALDGSLWIGADFDGGLSRLKDGLLTRYSSSTDLPNAPLRVLQPGRNGALWIGSSRGLSCFRAGKFTTYTVKEGLPHDAVRALCEDHSGNLWVGTEGGLGRRRNGQWTVFTRREGLSDNTVLALHEDSQANLWIGTATGGLNRLSLAHDPPPGSSAPAPLPAITSYTTRQGLFSDEIFEILEDDHGWLWMSCSKGVFRVNKDDLHRLDQGTGRTLVSLAYGRRDGMESPQCNGNGKPAACKTRDGRLCFVTSKGLAVVDPNTLTVQLEPPPVHIEQFLADKTLVTPPPRPKQNPPTQAALSPGTAPLQALVVPPGRGDLEFRYTALNLQAPEETRFKYRLESVDADWIDAGTSRVAHYNNVGPGSYRFCVLACNPDGVWNQQGAELAFIVQPHWWQTWWWRPALLLLLLATAAGTARYITGRRMQRKLALLEQRHAIERERGRIAKDIHDDLGSSLTRIMMLGERAEEELSRPSQIDGQLGKIVATARHSVRALDEIVWAVNPENDTLEGLAQYISHYADELFENSSVSCRLEMPAELPAIALSAELRHDLFLLVKEALHNVLKHAHASRLLVQLSATAACLEVTIQDDGCGFAPGQPVAGRHGNGIRNLRLRAQAIRAQLDIHSAPGQGTTIKITLPLSPDHIIIR